MLWENTSPLLIPDCLITLQRGVGGGIMSLSHSYLMPLGLLNSPQRCFRIFHNGPHIFSGGTLLDGRQACLACPLFLVVSRRPNTCRTGRRCSSLRANSDVNCPPLCCGRSPQIFWSDAVEFYLSVFPPEIDFNAFRGLLRVSLAGGILLALVTWVVRSTGAAQER